MIGCFPSPGPIKFVAAGKTKNYEKTNPITRNRSLTHIM